MPELLTIFACLSNNGCSETSNQYYATHPVFAEFVKTEENRVKEALPVVVTEYWVPVVWVSAGRESTVRLTRDFSLSFSINKQVLRYGWEF